MGDSTEEKSYKGKPRKKQTTKYTYAYIIVEKKDTHICYAIVLVQANDDMMSVFG